MYPDQELTRLATHKAALRQSITRHRSRCATAAARALQPVAWLDRMIILWRKLPPFVQLAIVPLGFLVQRSPAPRSRRLGSLLRWAPVVLGAVRSLATGHRP